MAIGLSHNPGQYDRTIRITVTSTDPTHRVEAGFGDSPVLIQDGVGSVCVPATKTGKLYVVENYGPMNEYEYAIDSLNTMKYVTLDNGLQFKVNSASASVNLYMVETYKVDDNKIIKMIDNHEIIKAI